jgi:hypothetical protein
VKEEDLYQEQCTSHYRKKPGRKENYNPIHQGHETKEKHRHPPWPMAELHPPTDADEEPQSMDTAARPGVVEPPPRCTWITKRVSSTPTPRIAGGNHRPSPVTRPTTRNTQQRGDRNIPPSAHEANLPSLPEEMRTTPRPDEARRKRNRPVQHEVRQRRTPPRQTPSATTGKHKTPPGRAAMGKPYLHLKAFI